jgi:ketosteroid isomerase-like protein
VIRFRGQGRTSTMPLDERVGFIWTVRAGRVTKVEDLGRVH